MSVLNRKKDLHCLGRRIEHPRPSEGRVFIPFRMLPDGRQQLSGGMSILFVCKGLQPC